MNINSVFYLKYRPQKLAEVIGQEMVKKTLDEAYKSNRLSHAYLFVGPRGTGKTSTARILAKMINCESQSNIPCNRCTTCLSITNGSSLDLIEIDAASNRGIEDIRSLREKIKLAPTSSKKKVYIIDEVHMLTAEAFNALLKTLEEPPNHALFIMATTDVKKVPQTIISRVQRLDFSLGTQKELLETIKKIAGAEKINIDEDALKLLVKFSDGSFRDAVKLLDQVSSIDKNITVKALQTYLKSSNFDNIFGLVESFYSRDIKKALSILLRQIEQGVEVKELIQSLMDSLRSVIFIKNGLGDELAKPSLSEDKYEEFVKISDSLSNKELVRILDILQNSLEKLRFASVPSLPLELAVVEICEGEKPVIATPPSVARNDTDKLVITETSIPSDLSDTQASPTSLESSDSPDITKLKEKWAYVCETIRPYNFSLEALLRSVRISGITDVNVIMEVPYSFHQRILEAPKNRDILEGVLSDILGRRIKLSCVLGNRPMQKDDIENIEVAQDDEIIKIASEIFNSDSVN